MNALVFLLALQVHCGVERWSVKTLTDPATQSVVLKPVLATVATLRSWPAPNPLPVARSARERQVYRMSVVVIGWKLEADQDFHIVVADSGDLTHTMIVEIPSGACTVKTLAGIRVRIADARATALKNLGRVSAKFRRFRVPVRATISGVAFFDKLHGQTGVAPNGIELHPVLGFTVP